jgi:hypothetical protein
VCSWGHTMQCSDPTYCFTSLLSLRRARPHEKARIRLYTRYTTKTENKAVYGTVKRLCPLNTRAPRRMRTWNRPV